MQSYLQVRICIARLFGWSLVILQVEGLDLDPCQCVKEYRDLWGSATETEVLLSSRWSSLELHQLHRSRHSLNYVHETARVKLTSGVDGFSSEFCHFHGSLSKLLSVNPSGAL